MNREGKFTESAARAIVTEPSSSGWRINAASRRTPFFVVLCLCQAKRKGAQSCTESFSFEKH
jgi:hypothetical protein